MHYQDKNHPLQSERSVKLQKLTGGHSELRKIQKLIKPFIRPLRILQFLVVLLIFALVTYTIALSPENVSSVTCILLIVLSGAYVFILAIDIISQLSGGELQSIPMFFFSFVGMILFGVTGILLLPVYTASALWTILTVLCLSLIMSVLFILDVVTALVFWKRNCDVCNDPYCTNQAQILYQKKDLCHPACTETVKFDLMTSVSSIKIPSGDEEAVCDHSYRKVGYGRRRQYVDRPASARSAAMVEVADIQTEPRSMCNRQSQTHREIKEMPVQTVSKCELCNRQIPIFSTSTDPMHQAMQQAPCTTCPAIMQLMRGAPCCPGCRCVTGIIQVSQQTQQQQTPRQEKSTEQNPVKETKHWQQPVDEKSYEIVTTDQEDPNVKGKSGTITKLTLASYSVSSNQTTDNSSQTATGKGVKNLRGSSDSEEIRKSRSDSEKHDNEKVKSTSKNLNETLIPEKEKAKSTNNSGRRLSISLPEKHHEPTNMKSTEAENKLAKSDPKIAEATVEKLTSNNEKSAEEAVITGDEAVEVESKKNLLQKANSEPGPREVSKMNNKKGEKISISLPETKQLISPPRLVAKMIDRLQEIEGNKQDTAMPAASEVITTENPSILNSAKPESDGKVKNITIEPNSTRGVAFDRSADQNRKSNIKSEDSALESSNLTVDSSKILSSTKVSRDSSASYGYSENQLLKPRNDKQKLNKVEQSSDSIIIPNPQTGTQTTDAEIASSSSRYKRTYVFPKKNKVEPAEVTHTDIDVQTGYEAQSEKSFTENSRTLQQKSLGICSACKRVQLPTTAGSFNYYSVYKDKRGRYYCEFCANPNSIKVLYKDGNEPKRLKCAGCGNIIRSKHSYNLRDELKSRNKHDNCPKCGQSQVQVSSVSY
nr:uncharacterized protein LOC117604563 isoform X2 [Osmia lignaria]